ncbi:MAG: hypothetical protein CPDRYDRY_4036 [uncultured Paraburkholderia sp.]|nr:MAG: hypothetical protein CPDRYDRY_4036 [uncultured Paraburkholderia sp.]
MNVTLPYSPYSHSVLSARHARLLRTHWPARLRQAWRQIGFGFTLIELRSCSRSSV